MKFVIQRMKLYISFFLIYFFSLSPSKGFIVVDYENVDTKKTRIIVLDTIIQKLVLYKEFNGSSTDEIRYPGESWYYSLSFSSNGVEVKSSENPKKSIIIRSEFKIVASKGFLLAGDPFYIWSSEEIKVKSPTEIQSILPKPKGKESQGTDFPITQEGAKSVMTLGSLSNNDKGKLGELCTTLTMLSFGYSPHPSKYGGDNGFDGVFECWNKKYLWLTQSKNEKKHRTAKNIMDRSLNEQKIFETVGYMKEKDNQQ